MRNFILKRNCNTDRDLNPEKDGLWPADINAHITPEQHIGRDVKGQFISLTSDAAVTVKYAVKKGNPIRICTVSTEGWSTDKNLHDYSDGGDLRFPMTRNFAAASKEWLAEAVHIPAENCRMIYDELNGDNRYTCNQMDMQAAIMFAYHNSKNANKAVSDFSDLLMGYFKEKKEKDMISADKAGYLFGLLDDAVVSAASGDEFSIHAVKGIIYAIIKSVIF